MNKVSAYLGCRPAVSSLGQVLLRPAPDYASAQILPQLDHQQQDWEYEWLQEEQRSFDKQQQCLHGVVLWLAEDKWLHANQARRQHDCELKLNHMHYPWSIKLLAKEINA